MSASPSLSIDLFGLRADGERIMFLPAVWPVVMDCDEAEAHARRVLELVNMMRAERHA